MRGRGGAGAWGYLWILRDCDADSGDLIVSSVNGSSLMMDFRFCLRLSNDSVLDSWMRMDRLVVALSSFLDFGCLIPELRGRVLFFSPSESEVLDVNDSLDAELRSFAVYVLRLPGIILASLTFPLKLDSPTAVAVEVVAVRRPPNKGRTLLKGRKGEKCPPSSLKQLTA